MGKSKIEWTDYTFNPWIGCTKVSEGCKYCYADRENKHYNWNPAGWGPQAARKRTSKANWHKPAQWNAEQWLSCLYCGWRGMQKDAPLNNFGEPRCPSCNSGNPLQHTRARVFCASLADIFDKAAPQEWREDLWNLIEQTPNLDWLLLTKRPDNIEDLLPEKWGYFGYWDLHNEIPDQPPLPRNIGFGISAEDQDNLISRWVELSSWAAHWFPSMLFLSLEPLLGSIDVDITDEVDEHEEDNRIWYPGVDWVIVGGESGLDARPMHPDWVRSIRDQCLKRELPFFFKQWGEWAPAYELDQFPEIQAQILYDKFPRHEFATGIGGKREAYRVGKKIAGRMLDGQIWNEFPEVTNVR